jgi:LysR family cys regulon transcriptional activator
LLTLEAIARYPIITYVFGVADRSVINRAFTDLGLEIRVVLTAADAEVIKTYVRTGLGIGIVARMAYDKRQDRDIQVLDAGNLFDASVTSLAIRKNAVLRGYVYDFIEKFAPHLGRETVDRVLSTNDKSLQHKLYDEHVAESLMR